MRRGFLVLSVIVLAVCPSFAQDIAVHGRFLARHAKVGEQVPYVLVTRYPARQGIVFPDSAYSYSPFEFERKVYFPTVTRNNISVDSAIFYLSTYEIDSVQLLALPAFVINRNDCTAVYGRPDTLLVQRTIKDIPPSVAGKDLPVKSNFNYMNVRWLLNYPLILLFVAIFIVLCVVAWIIFGKRIRRYFLVRKLTKDYNAFAQKFGLHIEKLRSERVPGQAESALADWKRYMERLASVPFTKFTTREILRIAPNELLSRALHDIDRIVYSGSRDFTTESFEQLRAYSNDQFAKRKQEVMHG